VSGDAARPAFYALRSGGWRDYVTLLHPPYTLWHLSYVAVGAALVPHVRWGVLGWTVLAFLLAMGVGAHALDELRGRPLQTRISVPVLAALAAVSITGASAIGIAVALSRTLWLLLFVAVGAFLVVAYNLELAGGRLHNDLTFGLAWGGFPVAVGYVAQSPGLDGGSGAAALAATVAAVAFTYAQRRLSEPARELRRRTLDVDVTVRRVDGTIVSLDRRALLAPLERALRALSWGVPLVALAVLLTHG